MESVDCQGVDGFVCIGGWLYTPVGGMIFATNRRCTTCFNSIVDKRPRDYLRQLLPPPEKDMGK